MIEDTVVKEERVKCKYLELKDIYKLGLLEKIINSKFKRIIKSIMPDGQVC